MLHAPSSDEWFILISTLIVSLVTAGLVRLATRRMAARAPATASARTYWLGLSAELVPWAIVIAGLWAVADEMPLRPRVHELVDRFLYAALAFVITVAVARMGARVTGTFAQGRAGVAGSTSIFTNVVRIAIYAVGFMVVLQAFNVSITPFITALGVGGIAVALALQDTLSNLFAGIHLLASKKVEPGDFIELSSGETGYVTDVNWRNTTIRQMTDNMVIIPNSMLASQVVINYNRPFQPMSVMVQCGVSYDSDLELVERVTVDVAREVLNELDGGVSEFEPTMRFHTFADSSIDFSVALRIKEYANRYLVTHEFIKRLHRRFNEERIEIPFPIRTIITKST